MIYELRIYRCVPGRKPALLSRFENETLRIWEKHGIRQAGFWTTLIGKSSQEITYMLAGTAWPSARSAGALFSPRNWPEGRLRPREILAGSSCRSSADC